MRRCVAVHPGYGFLSENVAFVEACQKVGVIFLGPSVETMKCFARKHTARDFAVKAQVPVLPGARPAPALLPPAPRSCLALFSVGAPPIA